MRNLPKTASNPVQPVQRHKEPPMKNCHKSFKDAALERQQHPLLSGLYKLREVCWDLGIIHRELDNINDFKRGRISEWGLECCTKDDIYVWLRGLPEYIAQLLGGKVLPALEALVADGASPAEIEALRPWLRDQAAKLVDDLEEARLDIRRAVGREYDRMRHGDPLLQPLVERAIRLTEEALSLAPSLRSCD